MYVKTVPNRNSRPAILLRDGWREGKRVRKRTLANLTEWPSDKVEALRRLLKGERLVAAEDAFVIERCCPMAMSRRCSRWPAASAWIACSPPGPVASATWSWR